MNALPFVKAYLSSLVSLGISSAAWAPIFQRFSCWQTALLVFCVLGAVLAPVVAHVDTAEAARVRVSGQ